MNYLLLSLILTVGFAQAAETSNRATFSEVYISCHDVWWMDLDGTVECRNPSFKAKMTNGKTTLRVDARLRADLRSSALKAQGLGICKLLGYSEFIKVKSVVNPDDVINGAAWGPYVTLNGDSEVVGLEKLARTSIDSVSCR